MRNPYEQIDMIKIARQMRKKMTPAERKLWERLRGRRLGGFKFLRQHVVRDSIADFYCHELRLIIEVDGEAHHSPIQQERDDERDFQLAAYGYCTVRVSNAEVLTDLDAVCKRLLDLVYTEIDHLL
ncbi:MAG: endonuclease domain-containing protein [Ignavibacteria bacterium]|nr:endonuclease domain-containing protein [Ignavibacteria bacterium]MBK6420369.1 endonuclease domain-containing protein [Ignavibacteria bacterium]MBK7033688.1 endonuclease domain-containing protein [Ignavibacteria bacterium]MBK7412671.1 endonuclease domain-containing protein [Ignavibacteria bacterium]